MLDDSLSCNNVNVMCVIGPACHGNKPSTYYEGCWLS